MCDFGETSLPPGASVFPSVQWTVAKTLEGEFMDGLFRTVPDFWSGLKEGQQFMRISLRGGHREGYARLEGGHSWF